MQKYFITIFLLFPYFFAFSQSEKRPKNSLILYYAPTLVKADFYNENSNSSLFNSRARRQPPGGFYQGYQIGGQYGRMLSEQLKLFIGYRHTLRGQQSDHHFFGDLSSGWQGRGGTSWDVRTYTNELLIGIDKRLFQNPSKKLSIGVKIAGGMDVHQRYIVKSYIIERETGIKTFSGSITRSGGFERLSFKRLGNNIANQLFRLGVVLGAPCHFELIHDTIGLYVSPEIQYLFDYLENPSPSGFIGIGQVFTVSIGFGIEIKI